MPKSILPALALLLSFFVVPASAYAQDCSPPAIKFNTKQENIFNAEQEMFLGDAMIEQLQRSYRVIEDDSVNGYLQAIGDRIVKHLPSSGIRFRLSVVDIPETNAFIIAGGRIFVTRKLISFVKNEDELAGVIAHELGHGAVRHGAVDMSRMFKRVLNVTAVGDRRDVFEKYNQWIEQYQTKPVSFSENHEDNQQLEADRIGIFALIAAGYDGNALTGFWTRFTKAKKTNFLSGLFGLNSPEDKRLTEMVGALNSLPASCREKRPGSDSENFEKWRASVISFNANERVESVPHLVTRRELVPLRSDIQHLEYSPNGEFILAQDDSTITVLKSTPLSLLFQIDAQRARTAKFTPDSSKVVVIDQNLRVEKWDVAEKRSVSVKEVSVTDRVWQTRLSPDGNILACLRRNGDLVFIDVATNEEIFRDKAFYLPTVGEYYLWKLLLEANDDSEVTVLNMKFSPDGKYFVAGRDFSSPVMGSRDKTIAIDVTTKKPIQIGDSIKKLLSENFAFISPDRVVGQYGDDISRSGVFAFPSGERIAQFELSGLSFSKSFKGEHLAVRPVVGAAVGVYDLTQKKYVFASKKSALDVYDGRVVAERKNGELAIYTIGKTEPEAVLELPKSQFGLLRTTALSDDGQLLAVSDRSRGAVWDLKTGNRVFHMRSFRGSFVSPDGRIFADFPKAGTTPRSMAVMNVADGTVAAAGEPITDEHARQHGRYLVVRRSKKQSTETEDKNADSKPFTEEETEKRIDAKATSLEIRDVTTGARLWSREFQFETPGYFLSPTQDSMVLVWRLTGKAAMEIIRSRPELSSKLESMKDRENDYLLQVVDPQTGAIRGNFMLETGNGSFYPQGIMAAGDYLLVDDDENRLLLYSIPTGRLLQRFFGSRIAVAGTSGLIAVENVPGRVTVYDVGSGRELEKLSFAKGLAAMNFSKDGKSLFVLTRDQTYFVIDATKFTAPK